MLRTWAISMKPTATRAGAAAWAGTIVANGVRKRARANRVPVTTLANPVRAPSPTPAADSTKLVLEEADAAPPATAARPSTNSSRPRCGTRPRSSSSPASLLTPTAVPMVSKKSVRKSVKTSSTTVNTPTCSTAPSRLNSPTRPKSGNATTSSGMAGTVNPHRSGAMSAISLTTIATTVITTIPTRMAPFTPRDSRATVSSTPRQKTNTGQPERVPSSPSWTGTEPVSPGTRVAKPASTKPTKAMNRPMPTLMACFICRGTAYMIASRTPVTTRTQTTMPESTTRPIASAQLMVGAIW